MLKKTLVSAAALLAAFATPASADLADARFGAAQIWDVQYFFSGSDLHASGFQAPFDQNFVHPTLPSGGSFGFFASTTNPGTYGLAMFLADGTLDTVLHNTGSVSAISGDAIFYIGSGFFGTVITPSQGFSAGGSAVFTGMNTAPTDADLTGYQWASLTPLAAGETAGGQSSPQPQPNVVTGSSVSGLSTLASLAGASVEMSRQLALQQAALDSALENDSRNFGLGDISVSLIGRYSRVTGEDSDGAAGLVAAYRLDPEIRVGAFVEQAVLHQNDDRIRHDDAPTFGGFVAWEENPDLTGFSARIAGVYSQSGLTISRDAAIDDAEGGTGRADLVGYGASAEIAYGVAVSPSTLVQPYVGVRYTKTLREGYTEDREADVTKPIAYEDFGRSLATAVAGLRVAGAFTETVGYTARLGAEYDIARDVDVFAGTSLIDGLESFGISRSDNANRLRASGAVGLNVSLAKNQTLTAEVDVRQQAYSANPVIMPHIAWTVGF